MRTVFGWKRADGTRLIRTVYIEIPKKNGKTEFAAGLALLLLLFDREFRGQVYSLAVSEDQAKIVFEKATAMVALSESLFADIEPLKTSLYCAELMAVMKPLAAKPRSKHGFHPSAYIADEIHGMPTGELVDIVRRSTGGRRQPLGVVTTHAGLKGWGYGWELHEYAAQVAKGSVIDPTFLAVIFAADEGDDWTDERVWAKANPNLGISPKLDYMRAECALAKASPRLENEFKRYNLNMWVGQRVRWIPPEDWAACAGKVSWKELPLFLDGAEAIAGLDLSATSDTTSLGLVFAPQPATEALARRAGYRDGKAWFVVPRIYVPADTLERRPINERELFKAWIRQGAVIATPGNVVDYAFVENDLLISAGRYRMPEVALDRWNTTYLATRLQDAKVPLVEFGQGYASMSAPSKEFERLVLSHQVCHGGHPTMAWMVEGVAIASDNSPANNIKPVKDTAGGRIDAVVSTIMGLGRCMARVKKPVPYADGGIVVV